MTRARLLAYLAACDRCDAMTGAASTTSAATADLRRLVLHYLATHP